MTEVLGFDFRPELYYNSDHVWLKRESDGTVKVGFDDIVAKGSHEIFFLKLLDAGTAIVQKKKLGVIESRKYSGPIVSSISGTIITVNPVILKDGPFGFMESPYDKGWLLAIKPSNVEADIKNLMQGDSALDWFRKAAEPLQDELELFKKKHA